MGRQVGKFYELYHMDAVIGIKELGLIAMKVSSSFYTSRVFGRIQTTNKTGENGEVPMVIWSCDVIAALSA